MCSDGFTKSFTSNGKRLGRSSVSTRLSECLSVDGGGGRRLAYRGMSPFGGLRGRMDRWEVAVVTLRRGAGCGDRAGQAFSIELESVEKDIPSTCAKNTSITTTSHRNCIGGGLHTFVVVHMIRVSVSRGILESGFEEKTVVVVECCLKLRQRTA